METVVEQQSLVWCWVRNKIVNAHNTIYPNIFVDVGCDINQQVPLFIRDS